MHDSYTVESPIPGERQVFSRPADQEPANSFMQSSYSGGGLPPLPEFPAYTAGSAVQTGMSNPLFGEQESSPDVVGDSEQDAQPSPQVFSHSLSQHYAAQPQATYNAYSSDLEAATAKEGQAHTSRTAQDPVADDYSQEPVPAAAVSSSDQTVHSFAALTTLALPRHSSDTASHITASAQSADLAAAPNSFRQAPSFTLHSQQGSVMEPPGPPSRSARSTTEMQSPSPTTPGVVDSAHSPFQLPDSQAFTPVHLPASRPSRTSNASESSRPQSSSSVQPVYQQAAPHSSSDMQYMQPEAVRAVYQDAEEQQSYASSREGYEDGEEDYREQYVAASRPTSAHRQQVSGRSHPARPYSPVPGRVPLPSASIVLIHICKSQYICRSTCRDTPFCE